MFILIPVLMPPVAALGIDPIHFLIVAVMTLTLGLVTPPIGVCLFAAAQVAQMRVEDVIRGSLAPMSILTLAILALVLPGADLAAPSGCSAFTDIRRDIGVMGVSGHWQDRSRPRCSPPSSDAPS